MFTCPLGAWCRSPVQSLPVELLSYIFILCVHDIKNDEDEERSLPFTTENIKIPLILASVNHHWRDIAHKTPSLWTSICVTVELIEKMDGLTGEVLNDRHLITYLSLSRNYPLDILIDARDQDWDFSEPEIPSEYECDTYTPPFSSSHMRAAIAFLLPHLSRWRSLNILTDSWAPMYVALRQIQPAITTLGAPLLESLTLMRCNDFVSYSPTFQPYEMKDPGFLNLADHDPSHTLDILPRLRNLTLRGVHVDWTSLSSILSQSRSSLRTLELSSHSMEVRPSSFEFHQLLTASPNLNKLVINGSGPGIPDDIMEGTSSIHDGLGQVSLPHLLDITLGYRSAHEGQTVLELLDAPNVTTLALEDSTHPSEPEDVDAGSLLTYLGTGEFPIRIHDDIVFGYTTPDGQQPAVETDSATHLNRAHEGSLEAGAEYPDLRAVFPLLEAVTLRGVKSCPRPLQAFFSSLSHLQRLELNGMSMQAVQTLLPRGQPVTGCPCPHLQSLCVRGFERLRIQDSVFLAGGLAIARFNKGACELREVNIHVNDINGCAGEDIITRVSQIGTIVRVIREVPGEEDEEEDMEYELEGKINPFKAGGAFNDPAFDAYYARGALAR